MRQLGRQNGGLHTVEAAVDAFDPMLMLHDTTVPRQHRHPFAEIAAVRYNGPGIPHRPKILPG